MRDHAGHVIERPFRAAEYPRNDRRDPHAPLQQRVSGDLADHLRGLLAAAGELLPDAQRAVARGPDPSLPDRAGELATRARERGEDPRPRRRRALKRAGGHARERRGAHEHGQCSTAQHRIA
jgi:hypothetical protein